MGPRFGTVRVVTAYEELTGQGQPGPEFAALLYRTVRIVAVIKNFPPPEGHAGWDDPAVFGVAHAFLGGDRGRKRILDLTIRSVDDRSLARQLEGAVLNHLRDLGRATDMGAFVRRVREVLRDAPDFDQAADRWTTTGGPGTPSTVPPDDLARAAAAEPDVTVPAWTSESRRAPLADRDSLIRLIGRVLTTAQGSLTAPDIAKALTARIAPVRIPLTAELDVVERIADPAPAAALGAVLSRIRAREIFDPLTERERMLVALYDRPGRDLGNVVGVRNSQAAFLKQRLAALLRDALRDDDDPDATITELTDLCTQWLADRT